MQKRDVTQHDLSQLFIDVPSLPFFLGGRVRLHVGYTCTKLNKFGRNISLKGACMKIPTNPNLGPVIYICQPFTISQDQN